jgi:hypothetical protein
LIPRIWILTALLALLALGTLAACGDDDDGGGDGGDDAAEVENVLLQLATADGADIDYFLDHTTDDFIDSLSGMTREECEADPDTCVGEPADDATVENVAVDGDTADADLTFIDQEGEFTLAVGLVKEDGLWKADSFSTPEVEVPEGATTVGVTALDYEFEYDASEITGGNVAFEMSNEGEEDHELVLLKVSEDFDIDTALESEGEQPPEGIEEEAGVTFAAPGESGTLVPEGELARGRYMMVCFIPTDDGTPHAALGMHSEFTIE